VSQPSDIGASIPRSQHSVDFETLWRGLPRTGPIPTRQAFKPRLAKAFLPHVMMLQAPSSDDPTLRVRLVGDAIVRQIGFDIIGQDYFEFLEEERRPAELEIVRSMFERPGGVWWVAPAHYQRGFSQYWEVTAFPLAGDERSPAAVLGLVRPADILFGPLLVKQNVLRVEGAVQFKTLDIHS
jgi:hypothetical protein